MSRVRTKAGREKGFLQTKNGKPRRAVCLKQGAALSLQHSDEIDRVHVGMVLRALFGAERTLRTLIGMLVDADWHRRVGAKIHQSRSHFSSYPEVFPALLACLHDNESTIRRSTKKGHEKIGLRAFKDGDGGLQAVTVQELSKLKLNGKAHGLSH